MTATPRKEITAGQKAWDKVNEREVEVVSVKMVGGFGGLVPDNCRVRYVNATGKRESYVTKAYNLTAR